MIRSRKPRERKKKKEPSLSTTLLKWGSVLPSKAKAMQVRLSQLGKSLHLQGCQGQFGSSWAGVILNMLSCMQIFWLFLSQWDLFGIPGLFRSLSFGVFFVFATYRQTCAFLIWSHICTSYLWTVTPLRFLLTGFEWQTDCSQNHLVAIWGKFPVCVLGFYHSLWCRMSIHLYCSFPLHSCCLLFPCY